MIRCTLKYFVLFCEIFYAFLIKSYANVSNCLGNAKDFKASMGFEVTHSSISVNSNPSTNQTQSLSIRTNENSMCVCSYRV